MKLFLIKAKDQIQNHPGFTKYLSNTSWLFLEKVIRLITGLFIGTWVARYLGPKDYGIFSYIQSLIIILVPISTMGLNRIIVRVLYLFLFLRILLL